MFKSRGTVRADPRTLYEAQRDIEYAISLATFHCHLYTNIANGIRWLTAFLASATVVGLLARWPVVSLALGVATAALTAFTAVVDLRKLAERHESDRKRFLALQSKSDAMTLVQIDKALPTIRAKCAPTLRGLEYPAFNDMARRAGRPDWVRPLGWWERLLDTLT